MGQRKYSGSRKHSIEFVALQVYMVYMDSYQVRGGECRPCVTKTLQILWTTCFFHMGNIQPEC